MSEPLPCEASMGLIRGREIQQFVKAATGETCPCLKGQACPLLSTGDQGPQRLEMPRHRSA